MEKFLGLDYGDKTVGVAVSDAMGWSAHCVDVLRRKEGESINKTLDKIAEYATLHEAQTLVLGLPKSLDNTEGERCVKTRSFSKKLQKRLPDHKIVFFDERYTTAAAERLLLEADVRRKKRSDVIDKMAAAQILQGFLDSRPKTN